MTSMRKVLGFLAALALGSFALPAAATYYYSLNMCAYGTGCTSPIAMTTASGVSTGTVTAIIKNESPANLTIKSFTLSVPAGSGLTITGATLPSGQTATKTIVGGTLTVKSMSIGVVKSAQYAVTLTVTTTSCANITGNWTAQPWTGSQLNGSKFVMNPVSATHPATTFTPACTVPITITSNPAAGGSASCTPNPVPYNGSSTCSVTSTTPGYAFNTFSGTCSGATCVLSNVTTPQTVVANFTLQSYPVDASVSGGHGSIVPVSQSVPFGSTAQLGLTPDAGYQVGAVTGTCGGLLTGSTAPFTWTTGPVPVNGCSVIASFTPISYTVTTAKLGNGTGNITPLNPGSSSVPFGTTPTFTVTATGGSTLGSVTDNCGPPAGSLSLGIYTAGAVPVGGCTVTATFTLNTLTFQNQPADAFPGSVITDHAIQQSEGQFDQGAIAGRWIARSSWNAGIDGPSDSCSIHGTAVTDSGGFAVFSTLSSTASPNRIGMRPDCFGVGLPLADVEWRVQDQRAYRYPRLHHRNEQGRQPSIRTRTSPTARAIRAWCSD